MHKPWWKRLLFPHPAVVVVLCCIAFPWLIAAFVMPAMPDVLVYASYVLSACALTMLCTTLPRMLRAAAAFRDRNRLVSRFRRDGEWRMAVTLRFSIVINAAYAAIQLISGLMYHSLWFYALAGYYALLAFVRLFLLGKMARKSDALAQLRSARLCGVVLLLIDQALTVIVAFIVWQNRGSSHGQILTIAMAAYTFYSLAMAIFHIAQRSSMSSPLLSAAQAVSLTAALVSILSLETAMLAAFGTADSAAFRRIITACTGGVICAAVLSLAVGIIVRSTREIRSITQGDKSNGQ